MKELVCSLCGYPQCEHSAYDGRCPSGDGSWTPVEVVREEPQEEQFAFPMAEPGRCRRCGEMGDYCSCGGPV